VAKRLELTITDAAFDFTRREDAIADEPRFDGIYVLRTSLSAEQSDAAMTVRSYKILPRWSACSAA
jgi:hypothetical protein